MHRGGIEMRTSGLADIPDSVHANRAFSVLAGGYVPPPSFLRRHVAPRTHARIVGAPFFAGTNGKGKAAGSILAAMFTTD